MCYHTATPSAKELEPIVKDLNITIEEYPHYYHVSGFNHPVLPVLTAHEPHKIQPYIWGFVPFFAKNKANAVEIANKTLNATCENVFTTPMYREAAKKQRCLIFSSGFYEWRWEDEKGKTKTPFFIHLSRPFAFGGIYNEWTDKETGEILKTCSIITTPANELMASIHNNKKRMPFIIAESNWNDWTNPDLSKEDAIEIMKPYPEGLLQSHEISRNITKRGFDTNIPEIQEKVAGGLF